MDELRVQFQNIEDANKGTDVPMPDTAAPEAPSEQRPTIEGQAQGTVAGCLGLQRPERKSFLQGLPPDRRMSRELWTLAQPVRHEPRTDHFLQVRSLALAPELRPSQAPRARITWMHDIPNRLLHRLHWRPTPLPPDTKPTIKMMRGFWTPTSMPSARPLPFGLGGGGCRD